MSAYAILNIDINALADNRGREAARPETVKQTKRQESFVPNVGKGFVNSWR